MHEQSYREQYILRLEKNYFNSKENIWKFFKIFSWANHSPQEFHLFQHQQIFIIYFISRLGELNSDQDSQGPHP